MDTCATLILVSLPGAMISTQFTYVDEYSWQVRQLLEPGKAWLGSESHGKILIYQGLKDTDVNSAMEDQYNRNEHMMFINTAVADMESQPLSDPDTGEIIVEDDGC